MEENESPEDFLVSPMSKTGTIRITSDEVLAMFQRAKARQQRLEEEGRRMFEEEQRIKTKGEDNLPPKDRCPNPPT